MRVDEVKARSTSSSLDAPRAWIKTSRRLALSEAPVDGLVDPLAAIAAARDAGLHVRRLTVRNLIDSARLETVQRARVIQAEIGGIRAFAPLPRAIAPAHPSTGYDDVRQVAMARLVLDNVESIQVDWLLYGPKLAQVALAMGADDVDGVSPFEGDLGRRRSPIEEIRGNIRAAGLEPVERNGFFESRG
jgi:aminodeoxyfutalosine synthase